MKKQNLPGYIMAIVGFIMLAVNAVAYIFNLDFGSPVFTVMGIVFIVIGMGTIRKTR